METKPAPGGYRAQEIETWLRSRGANFLRAIEIPINAIDERRSQQNQARPQPVVKDAVERYVTALRAGAEFPPIVAYRTGGKGTGFVVIDGNNRLAAHRRAGRSSIWAYVLASDTPSELIRLLTVEANSHHPEPVPTEWRVQQAVQLISIGWTVDVACQAANVSRATVTQQQSVMRTDLRVAPLKIKGWAELPASTRYALGQIPDDAILRHAAYTVISNGVNADGARALVRDIKSKGSEAARLEVVQELNARLRIESERKKTLNRKGPVASPVTSLTSAIGKILAVSITDLERSVLTERDRDALATRLREAAEQILQIQVSMETLFKDAR